MREARAGDVLITSPQADFDSLRFVATETACPYLPNRLARNEAFYAERLDGSLYERLLGRGFRRSGRVVYRPRCRGCAECRSLRVPVGEFAPSRSLRRVWRKNADLHVTIGPPVATDDKFDLFLRYLETQHDQTMGRTFETFHDFLYDSPTQTIEFAYHLGRRLVGVSLADCCPGGLSSVYMYFEPDCAARSLGTYSVLWEIDHCRRAGLSYYYLGYHVAGCGKMSYKSHFHPYQILVGDDRWVTFRE